MLVSLHVTELLNFLTVKNGVGFDETLGKWALLAFSEKNRSCKLIAASKVNFFIATPMSLKMFEQIWLEYFVTPVTKLSNNMQQPMSHGQAKQNHVVAPFQRNASQRRQNRNGAENFASNKVTPIKN